MAGTDPIHDRFKSLAVSLVAGVGLAVTLATATPAAAAELSTNEAFTQRVVQLTNEERVKAGLAPFTVNPSLNKAAQGYAELMAGTGCFSHGCGPVPEMAKRIEVAGFTGWSSVAENIAAGYRTPEEVVKGWMSSPGHRANILNGNLREIGVGLAQGSGSYGSYWAQEFGTRRNSAPAFQPVVVEAAAPAPEPAPAQEVAPAAPVEETFQEEMAPEEWAE